jgi:hypothetical protein
MSRHFLFVMRRPILNTETIHFRELCLHLTLFSLQKVV